MLSAECRMNVISHFSCAQFGSTEWEIAMALHPGTPLLRHPSTHRSKSKTVRAYASVNAHHSSEVPVNQVINQLKPFCFFTCPIPGLVTLLFVLDLTVMGFNSALPTQRTSETFEAAQWLRSVAEK